MTEVFTAAQNEYAQKVFRAEYDRHMDAAVDTQHEPSKEHHYEQANMAWNMMMVFAKHSEFS